MYLPQIEQKNNNRSYINIFKGYNHNRRIDDAEFYDMKNMTADEYPILTSRDPRPCVLNIASDEYEDVSISVTKEFIVDSLSLQYARYVITFTGLENNEYIFTYTVNKDYVGKVAKTYTGVKVNSYSDGKDMLIIPAGTKQSKLVLLAYQKDGATGWTEENLNLFLSGFQIQRHNKVIRGILLKQGKLAYMIGSTLYWNKKRYDFSKWSKGDTEVQLISFGAYILIFPEGLYLNTQDTVDYGWLGARYVSAGDKITYSLSNMSGGAINYTLSSSAPQDPEDGKYWMKQSDGGDALYQWSETMAMWVAVTTTYIKILVEGSGAKAAKGLFEQYDSIRISGASVSDLNVVNIIRDVGETTNGFYLLVTGSIRQVITQNTSESAKVTFERQIPTLDHVCVSNNRVWGCHYGPTEEEECVNEIYACKLGDPKNWYSYMGTARDSYALSMGEDGEFTGAYTYQGYPLFFKENNVYKIYGTYPAAYQLVTYDCRGLQKGSSKSLAIVDEYLVYKSVNDICVFDGNYPMSLSAKLGKRVFTEAAAGSFMSKYYISMKDEQGKTAIYVYDFTANQWMKDEDLDIDEFISTKSGHLYGRTKVNVIGFGNASDDLGLEKEDEQEGKVSWYLESGELGHNSPDPKQMSRIAIRAALDFGAMMKLSISYDDESRWHEQTLEKGFETGDGKIRTYVFPIIPAMCDTMKYRISGVGKARIYSIAMQVEDGGEI